MSKEIITFSYIKVEQHKFYQQKNPILIHDVSIDRIVVSNKVSFGKKKVLNILLGTEIILKKLCSCV